MPPALKIRAMTPGDVEAVAILNRNAFGPGRFARTAFRVRESRAGADGHTPSPLCRVGEADGRRHLSERGRVADVAALLEMRREEGGDHRTGEVLGLGGRRELVGPPGVRRDLGGGVEGDPDGRADLVMSVHLSGFHLTLDDCESAQMRPPGEEVWVELRWPEPRRLSSVQMARSQAAASWQPAST